MWSVLYSSLMILLTSDSLKATADQNLLDFGEVREEGSVKYLRYPFPDLPYPYNGLEPLMDERTLRAHHGLHHKAYTNKMNAALYDWSSEVKAMCFMGVASYKFYNYYVHVCIMC